MSRRILSKLTYLEAVKTTCGLPVTGPILPRGRSICSLGLSRNVRPKVRGTTSGDLQTQIHGEYRGSGGNIPKLFASGSV